MKKPTKMVTAFTLGLFALGFFFINKAEAQEGCGVIDYLNAEDVVIENCSNPFGVSEIGAGQIKVAGVVLSNNETVNIEGEETDRYYRHDTDYRFSYDRIFRHEATGYVEVDSAYHQFTEEDYWVAGEAFFGSREAADQYVRYEMGEGADTDSPDWDWDTYIDFVDFYMAMYQGWRSPLGIGTYTAVYYESLGVSVAPVEGVMDRIFSWLIPTAHAQYTSDVAYTTVTFTIANPVEPTGPSSVLFLPGIMGSNLYEESDECNLFGGVDEVKRWVSTFDCDVERMVMDENGVSINNLYTKTEDGVVEDVFLVSNLYDSFIEELEELKDGDKIADYRAVPYDWRLRLIDILKTINIGGRITLDNEIDYKDGYVYKSLNTMVDASPSKKVVLVGHSNGGLVIKTLLATMKAENDPLLESIEKVVLVAVPQAGTPEAVLGMLHGVEIGIAGVAVDQVQSRQLINTAPFGYHLLPDHDYFEMVDTPVITIESGTSTDAWRGQFGAAIDTKEELNYFLEKGSGRPTPTWEDTKTPATAYAGLLNYARSAHGFMTDWQPAATKVYEVAGTGVDTPAAIEYFTDTHCERFGFQFSVAECVEFSSKLGYRIYDVVDGDGTVVTPSALAVPLSQGSDKWYLDLQEYDSFTRLERKHKNIFEVEDVQSLVSGVISSSTLGGYRFLSKTEPVFEVEERLIYRLHSPLDLYVVLHDGEVVGSSTPYLRGVEYRRYGELQQLSIPEGETDYEIRLSGVATGSFTLDIDYYEGDDLVNRQTYSAVPSSTSTQVSLKVEGDEDAVLEIDYQGDGFFEAMVLPGLAFIVPMPSLATTTPAVPENGNSSSGTKVGVRGLPSAPSGALSGGQSVTSTQQELMLQLIALLTQYRDLLIKLKVQ